MQPVVLSDTYNLSGALVEQVYPSGRRVKNVLDNNGDLSIVQSAKCLDGAPGTGASCGSQAGMWNYAQHFTYNAAGAVTSMQLGNGRWESTAFNSRLQPTQIALGTVQNGTDKLQLEYGYGTTANNGNILSQIITVTRIGQSPLVLGQTYSYDSLNRIQQAEEKPSGYTQTQCDQNPGHCWRQTFVFDRYGNRNLDTSNGATTTLPLSFDPDIYNPSISGSNNRFTSGQGWTYDAAGNVITDAEGRTFTYDAENKQIEVENSSEVVIGTYYFDGDGKRVKKVVPETDEVTIFVYDAGGKLIGEYSTVVETQDPKIQYLTADHLGSPRISTDQDGNVSSRTDYLPYGEEITGLGGRTAIDNYTANDVRQGFTGYENDEETGLEYAQARYYSSRHARFTGSDPYNIVFEKEAGRNPSEKDEILKSYISRPQLWNRYPYVANNPLRFVDPSGEILELTGDERDRQQAFERVKQLVGEKAASLLKISERDGRYFVEYSGNNNTMWAADKMAGIVADLIDSNVVNEFQIVYGNSVTDANGRSHSFSAQGGAVTVPVSSTRTQIFVSYNAVNIASGIGFKDGSGNPLINTTTTIDAHEFGHAWGIQKNDVYNQIVTARKGWAEWFSSIGSSRGTKESVISESNNGTAVLVENIVRDRLKLPRKIKHQP